MIGESLGPYKILEPLGAGGMGEVYLGEDTRLGRKVAIKVLPPEFASDPERLARFEQEARAAAALNHPHIAVVHDVGSEAAEDGTTTHFMVQEYLEGQSLRERLEKGALPLEKTLDLATEVGEALIAAHKAGIIHRDLKPDNIFVTEEGHAKVLDFGLAKLTEMAAATGTSASMSPTMLGTVAGQVMGTAGYMAPEQINGEEIDPRADLFAFGAVFYEMITGRRAFAGDNIHETLSRIISKQPQAVHEIRDDLPLKLGWIIDKALAKDAGRRYQTATGFNADLAQLQDDITAGVTIPSGGPSIAAPLAVETTRGIPWKLGVPVAVAITLVAVLGTWWATLPVLEPPMYFEIELPEGVDFSSPGRRVVAISPDGSRIVFVANNQLWMRLIDDLVPTPIPGTEDARSPFFSHDGQQVGFEEQGSGQLKRVAVTGGTPVPIDVIGPIFGASWADNDMIYLGQGPEGIWQVPGTGGTPQPVVEMQDGERAHGPQLLPGAEWLLFTLRMSGNSWNEASIVAQSLVTEDRVVLIQGGTEGRWVPTGHLVYVLDGTLFAVAFDPGVMEPPSGATSMVEGISVSGQRTGAAHYGFSENGRLVYVPGIGIADTYQLVWVDREGQVEALPFEPRDSSYVDLSPDGQRIALEITGDDGESDIWIYETERAGSQVLLTTEGNNRFPVWSPGGDWVFFASRRGGNYDIWKRRADRSLDAELVLDIEAPVVPTSISADGKMLLVDNGAPPSDGGILALDLDADQEPKMLAATPDNEFTTELSPDGRFFTYHSNETGQFELYVMEVASGRTFPISTSIRGGAHGRWSQDGSEIYYAASNGPGILVAEVDLEAFSASDPREISGIDRRFRSNFDVMADGQRFLVTTYASVGRDGSEQVPATPRVNVILNWFEKLKQQVPGGR